MRDLNGVTVVVSGTIEGESRRTAEAKLREAGAIVQSSVGTKTQLLVTGMKVGKTKLDAAAKHGAEVVPWQALWNGSAPAAAWEEVQPTEYPSSDGLDLTKQETSWVQAAESLARWKPEPQTLAPRMYGPMLAKAGEVPTGPEWVHEVKWDGYRCLAHVRGGEVQMISRSAKSDYVETFGAIAELLKQWPDVVLDGELVNLDDQSVMTKESAGGCSFVVFDVLECFGGVVTTLPWQERRAILDGKAFDHCFASLGGGRIIRSPVFDDGEALLADVTERGWEGIVSKTRTAAYAEGVRGWIKVKLRCQQEFVVLGWVPGNGSLEGTLGGLALGVRENGGWTYVGRAGTGMDEPARDELFEMLQVLPSTPMPPADVETGHTSQPDLAKVVWVFPTVVVDVAFQKWTRDGRLAIPSIKSVRTDKDALDVTRAA